MAKPWRNILGARTPVRFLHLRCRFKITGVYENYVEVQAHGSKRLVNINFSLIVHSNSPFHAIGRDPPPRPAELALIREYDPQGFWTRPPKESAIDP